MIIDWNIQPFIDSNMPVWLTIKFYTQLYLMLITLVFSTKLRQNIQHIKESLKNKLLLQVYKNIYSLKYYIKTNWQICGSFYNNIILENH